MARKKKPETKASLSPTRAGGKTSVPVGLERCPDCRRDCGQPHPYRVFISYSHGDKVLADSLRDYLRSLDLLPIADHEIRVGEAFSEEIRDMIECAHVFMPLVTPNASKRLWVHQEIGYAMALHVPICPVAIGELPPGMAGHIQGIHLSQDGAAALPPSDIMDVVKAQLTGETIAGLVQRASGRVRQGRYDCAANWTDRQGLLVALTEAAYRSGCQVVRRIERTRLPEGVRQAWRLRQRTAFGSFSIPDVGLCSQEWANRDPGRYHTEHERGLLRRERRAMEDYAMCFGCDLILDPFVWQVGKTGQATTTGGGPVLKHSPQETRFRLNLLKEFLRTYRTDHNVRLVFPENTGHIRTNLTVVGDWFASEAVVPRYPEAGYEQTVFTRHAPTVLRAIDRFDQDFQDHMRALGFNPTTTEGVLAAKADALRRIDEWLEEIDESER